jgi:CubicO group peptidase (beta-lactamase class C family)
MNRVSSGFGPQLAQIPATLQAFVDDGSLAGAVTLLWRANEIAQVTTVGYRDLAAKAPMTRDAIFHIGSMCKPITSVVALMLMEEGKIRLEDPITKWLPEFGNMRVLRDPEGALDDTYPAPRLITLGDLLCHRAGFTYAFGGLGPIVYAYEDTLGPPLDSPLTPDEWLRALSKLPLLREPGSQFVYGHSTDVLGFLVGRIEGKTLGKVVSERILEPLAMRDTAFWCPPRSRDRLAHMYRPENGVLVEATLLQADSYPRFESGGGGLYSTADDYLRFARMLFNNGEVDGVRLLRPESVGRMRTNVLTDEQRKIPMLGLPWWAAQGFGLGVSMVLDPKNLAPAGVGAAGAFGWPGAYGTWWQADPANDLIAIYLIQDFVSLEATAAVAYMKQGPTRTRLALPAFQKLVYDALPQ